MADEEDRKLLGVWPGPFLSWRAAGRWGTRVAEVEHEDLAVMGRIPGGRPRTGTRRRAAGGRGRCWCRWAGAVRSGATRKQGTDLDAVADLRVSNIWPSGCSTFLRGPSCSTAVEAPRTAAEVEHGNLPVMGRNPGGGRGRCCCGWAGKFGRRRRGSSAGTWTPSPTSARLEHLAERLLDVDSWADLLNGISAGMSSPTLAPCSEGAGTTENGPAGTPSRSPSVR